MSASFTETFFSFLEVHRISPKDVADAMGKKIQTIYNWRTNGVPKSQRLSCQAYMDKRSANVQITNTIVMEPSSEQFRRWNESALSAGLLIEEWAMRGLDELADKQADRPHSKLPPRVTNVRIVDNGAESIASA